MYRKLIDDLKKWQNKKDRLPLILQGARQTGKTWLLKEFGKTCFEDVLYINFDDTEKMTEVFDKSTDTQRIMEYLSAERGKKIVPGKTLMIFDEIQEVPKALTSLKYFAENAPEYHVCCAGSLLGVGLHRGTSFPVGKVDFLSLAPMSFEEFLLANNESMLVDFVRKAGTDKNTVFDGKLSDYMKKYIITGGMPAVVNTWIRDKDFELVEERQKGILDSYVKDFSKHAPHNVVPRIRHLWDSLPSQLSKENRKFIYGLVREGARAREYEEALLWLSNAGLIRKVGRVTKAAMPLAAYADIRAFKLYHLDVGLLRTMAGIAPAVIMENNGIFEEFKGALAEQFVLQEMACKQAIAGIFYWTSGAEAEVDFIISTSRHIYPVEVKSGANVQAKSLKVLMDTEKLGNAVRFSLEGLKQNGKIFNVPLYLIFNMEEYLKMLES
jgi:predicted AAA+ superfamily ATPase